MSANEWIAPAFGIIGAVVGAVVGAGISYYVQTKTQRNAWKREYSVKIAETVYATLYSNVKGIKTLLENGKFDIISFAGWSEFQKDHRQLQVRPDKFRAQLDEFLKKIEGYDRDVLRLIQEVFPDIVQKASEKVFELIPDEMNINVKCKQSSGRFEQGNYTPVFCLRERKYPRELLMESFPDSEIVSFSVDLGKSHSVIGHNAVELNFPTNVNEEKFKEFWKSCLELGNENEIYKRVLQKQSELLKESKIIFKELEKRMEDIIP